MNDPFVKHLYVELVHRSAHHQIFCVAPVHRSAHHYIFCVPLVHRSAHLYVTFSFKIASARALLFSSFCLSLAMPKPAFRRSCTSSLGTKDGIQVLKDFFKMKDTRMPDVALATMSRWGRGTPSGADLVEYAWLADALARHCPTLLLTPTDVNAWFEELHHDDDVDLGKHYKQEAKRWSGVLRKGLSKYRDCAKYESKMQTALNRCTDPEADALLELFKTLDLQPSPNTTPAKTSPTVDVVVAHEQAVQEQAVHVTAIDFEALLAVPAHATSHVDFEALLSDVSDTSPLRKNNNHILQLTMRDDANDPIARPNIKPLPAGVGEISRALPKGKKGEARKGKPAKEKKEKAAKEQAAKAVPKPMKTLPRNVKPKKAVAEKQKTLSTTRHCVVSRAYKRTKKQACCVCVCV